ncbi:beta-lactamase family protein [Candidatus Woesearchaeota archaeon]|nr:beta-lactamase family protein [Candidatus Woesearchaeota archaeon]
MKKEEGSKKKISRDKINCINKIINTWLDYQQFIKRIPCLSIGIIHKDKIIFSKGYGYSDLEQKKKATDKTLYRIASISKIFTAISIMQLVEKEKINLDDDVLKYIPWLKSKNKITVRQLLTHSSGIDRDGNTSHWTDNKFPDLEKIKKHVSQGAVIYPPIEKFKYSNLGYALLGVIIEKVSRTKYDKYVKTNILDKLKLKETYSDINKEAESNLATGYGRAIPEVERDKFNNTSTKGMISAAGFISNTIDLCKFMHAQFLSNDLLLNKDTKKEMQRIQWVEESENKNITRGIGYEIWKNDGTTLRGHGGGFPGFITQIGFDRDREVGVVVLTNSLGNSASELVNGVFHIIDFILKNYEEFKQPKSKNKNLRKYEGRFYEKWGDLEVVEINGSLNLFYPNDDKPLKEICKLKHKNKDTFILEKCDNFDYLGEDVTFKFDNVNKLIEMKVGQVIYTPFKDFIQKARKNN